MVSRIIFDGNEHSIPIRACQSEPLIFCRSLPVTAHMATSNLQRPSPKPQQTDRQADRQMEDAGALAPTLPAHAGDGSAAADNTLVLVSSALVLLMTPGLAFFYGGFVQGRNVLNTMGMSLVMMGIATLVWTSIGFSLAFADGGAMNALAIPSSTHC